MKKVLKKAAKPSGYTIEQGVSQSMLAQFVTCRTACRLMLDGWRSPTPKRATQFGSLIHALLESWYGDSSEQRISSEAPVVFQRVARDWEKRAAKEGDKPEEVQADLAMAKAVFPAYVARWHADDSKRKWVEVEQVFDFVDSFGFRRRGKIDSVFEAKNSALWVLETKTASQISEDTLSQALAFDFQSLWYVQAVEAKLRRKVAGVLYNVVRVPQIGKGDDKASGGFVEKVRADIEKRPEFYFVRFEIPFSKGARERFSAETEAKLVEFRQWLDGKIPTYKNEFACRAKWNCSFLPVCACGGDPKAAGFKQSGELFSELKEEKA